MCDLPNPDEDSGQPPLWDATDADVWAYCITKDDQPDPNPYEGVGTNLVQDSDFND